MIKNLVRGFDALPWQGPFLSATAVRGASCAAATVQPVYSPGTALAQGDLAERGVLVGSAVVAPRVESGCKLTGGTWTSYYDGREVTSADSLDIDHMVPLTEAWDSK